MQKSAEIPLWVRAGLFATRSRSLACGYFAASLLATSTWGAIVVLSYGLGTPLSEMTRDILVVIAGAAATYQFYYSILWMDSFDSW